MAIGGVGDNIPKTTSGSAGPKGVENTEEKQKAKIEEQLRKHFNFAANAETHDNEINTENESNIFNNAINALRNQFPGASAIIDKVVESLTGGNKTEQTQSTEPTGTIEDVEGATNEPVSVDSKTTVDNNGNVSNFGENPDGEQVTVGDNNITVTDSDGKSVGGMRLLPNGMQVLIQPDGQEGVYDPKKGEFLPDNEAKKILAEMG